MSTLHAPGWRRSIPNPLRQILDLTSGDWSVYEIRRFATARIAWAVPSADALQAILDAVAGGSIVEIGAGRGYWAHLLSEIGGDVRAFDTHGSRTDMNDYTWASQPRTYRVPPDVAYRLVEITHRLPEIFHPVESGGPDRADEGDLLFLCWPPMSDMARVAVECFRGDAIAYVGEGWGGCTASDDFHQILQDEWRKMRTVYIPTWPGYHDALTIYSRR